MDYMSQKLVKERDCWNDIVGAMQVFKSVI